MDIKGKNLFLTLLLFGLALLAYFILPESCPEEARRCGAIFVLAAGFWSLNLFPPYVTSLVVVLLLCFTLGGPLGEYKYTIFIAPFSSPVLMLFFGSFVLAEAVQKNGCDRFLASKILSQFSRHPSGFLFGIMLTTAFLSMWISNTAATVIMLGIARPIYESGRLKKSLMLSIPFSANIGGVATPVGTPPNALAIGFLSDFGIAVSFFDWMILCVPLMLLLLGVLWVVMPKEGGESIQLEQVFTLSANGSKTLVIGGCTILLWLSAPLHGIPEPLTALLCAGALLVGGLIDQNNIKSINWDVLILMWGGLALGVGIEKTGLGHFIVGHLFPDCEGIALAALFGTLALVLSLFISNTAAAALIIPIALEATPGQKPLFAITIALMCSVAMIFPVSTPPNALAYGTGLIRNQEMVRMGALVTICCYVIILAGFWWLIPLVC